MKKIIILIIALALLTGCDEKDTNNEKYVYEDLNGEQGYSEDCYTSDRYFGGAHFCKIKADFGEANYMVVKKYELEEK